MIDRALAALAGQQNGVFTRRDAVRLGFDTGAIDYRLAIGRWHKVFRCVYSLTPQVSIEGQRRAAVLSVGEDAAAGRRMAALLHGFEPPATPFFDVVCPRHGHSRGLIKVHREPLAPAEVDEVDGIRVTSVARTLADLARTERHPRVIEKAIERADVLRVLDMAAIEALSPARSRRLLAILGRVRPGTTITAGHWEEVWLAIARRHGLTGFTMNLPHALPDGTQVRIDVYFPAARLAVEIDDRTHLTPEARRRDAHRDRQLALQGIACVRYPVEDLAASAAELPGLVRARARR